MKKLSIIFLALILFGCATSPPATESDKIRNYEKEYDKLFDALKITLFDLECQILNTDKDGGILYGRQRITSELTRVMMTGKHMYIHYDIILLKKDISTTIKINIYGAYEDGTYKTPANKERYDSFWEKFIMNIGS